MSGLTVVTVHNRADGDTAVARFESSHVPRVGELVEAWPSLLGDSGVSFEAFGNHSMWRVDQVIWQIASPNSPYALDYIRRESRSPDGGLISRVDLLCWPEQGPYWHDNPVWAPSNAEGNE